MLLKKGYKCSIATTGDLPVVIDPTKSKKDQLQEAKAGVSTHYIQEYEGGIMSRENPDGDLKDLIGTKRPTRKWEHTNHEKLHCFYAGKVKLCYYELMKVTMDGKICKCLSRRIV
jgi:hypothetical protein